MFSLRWDNGFLRSLGQVLSAVIVASSLSFLPLDGASQAKASGPCDSQVATNLTIVATQDGDDCVVAFKSGSGNWTVPSGVVSVDILVVGGGGGGGYYAGGGAGEFIEEASQSLVPGSVLSVTVGSGGDRGGENEAGSNGQNSSFGSVTAYGGGGGSATTRYDSGDPSSRTVDKATFSAGEGGSGGGGIAAPQGNWNQCPSGVTTVSNLGDFEGGGMSSGTSGAGLKNAGGNSLSICYLFSIGSAQRSFWVGAGGGGAGEPGYDVSWAGDNETLADVKFSNGTPQNLEGPGFIPGAGGSGTTSKIVVTSQPVATSLGVGQVLAGSVYFSGGGGGGANFNASGLSSDQLNSLTYQLAGFGGLGGGGGGGSAGAINTGGGGGGWRNGDGGSGVVIVRYAVPNTLTLDNGTSTSTLLLQPSVSQTISPPTRAGYTFAGWSTTTSGAAQYAVDLSDFTMGSQDITLYAVWESTLAITTPTSGLSGAESSAFSLAISASGGVGAKVFSATGLPSGLAISTTSGVISGTPSIGGAYSVSVSVTDADSNVASTAEFTLNISGTLSGGSAPNVSAPSGQLKQILASWNPVANATSYTVKVYNVAGDTELASVSGVLGTSITITTGQFGSIEHDTEYKVSVTPIGTGNFASGAESPLSAAVRTNKTNTVTFNYLFDAGGVSIQNFVTGGTIAEVAGKTRSGFSFQGWSTTQASGTGVLADKITSWPYTPAVNANFMLYAIWAADVSITTPSTGLSAVFDEAFSLDLSGLVSGGAGGYTYSATGLGSGLSINQSSGVISGTPFATGTLTVTVTVTDSDGNSATSSNFTISIAQRTLANSSAPSTSAPAGQLKQIFASWDAVANASSYTVKIYNSAGDTVLASVSGIAQTSTTITATEFASIADDTEYQVSVTANGTGNYVAGAESAKSVVRTNHTYSITWDGNGGTLGGGEAATFIAGGSVPKPTDPTKSNLVFVGWSTTEASDQGEIDSKIYQWPFSPVTNSALSLYATWLPACSVFKRSLVMSGTYFTFFERVGFSRQADCATVIPEQVDSVDVLVIGGGGGGGNNLAGGGGGGGVIFKTGIDVTADRVMVQSEGAGGAGGQNVNGSLRNGQTGGPSFAALSGSILIADGGSGGLTYWQNLTCSGGGATNAGSRAAGGAVSTASSDPSTGGPGKLGGGSSTFAGGAPILGEYWYNTNFSSRFPWSAASGGGGGGAWKSFPNQNMTGGLGGGGQGGWDGPNNGGRDAFVPGSGGGGGGTSCGSGGRGADGAVQIRYESIRFALTFSPGATGTGSDQSRTKIELVNTSLPDASTAESWFSRVGHDIVGWTTTDGGAQTHALGATLTSDADFTFYPVWQPKTYTITFSAGVDGTGADFSVTKSHGIDITLPNEALANSSFTRNGFQVSGWSTTSAGAAKDFDLGATYSGNADTTLYPYWRELAIEAVEDTWIRSGANSGTNYGYHYQLELKNAQQGTFNSNNRVAYLKFRYDPSYTWSGAVLEVYSTFNDAGSAFNAGNLDSSSYGKTYTTFNIEVFAASDASWNENTLTFNSANSSNQDWGLDPSTWPWGIDGGTFVGNLSIPADPNARNNKFSMSTAELDDFLNADPDGEITLFLRRSDLDANANLSLASSEHPLFPGPTIFNAGSGREYRVAYDINGGSGQLPLSGVYTEGGAPYTIATTSGIIPPANSSLVGWNTMRDGNGTDFASGDSYSSTKSMTLYAIYEPNPKVTFFSNYSGGPASVSQFVTPSTDTALRKNTFTRTGYTFTGWATQANGSGTQYADQANISISSDVELYAKWSANTYTVLYNYVGADGGDADVSDSFVVDSGNHITLPVPTKTGHNFEGWFENSNYSGSALGATYSPTQNITLTAKWDAIEYRIYYNTTNGTGTAPTDPNTYNYSQSAVVLANTSLTRLGYRFGGWTVNSDGSGTALNAGQTITFSSPSDIQLYPKWIANNYSISYNLNGGSGSLAGAPTSYSPATGAVTLPSTGFTKTGYDFDGWAITQNGQPVSYANFTTFTNITLYAVWDLKNISYTFDKGTATGQNITDWPANSSAFFASTFSLPTIPNTPVTIGGQPHIFSGWSDGTNTYQGGSSYLMGATSPTFTALWSEVYDVSYVFGGGSLAGETNADTECVTSGLCTDGQQITLHLAPSRTGYEFEGWKVQDTAVLKAGGASHIVSSSAYIFYAQWTAIDYVMSFDSNFGSNNVASSTKNIGQQLVMPNPGTRTGYTFTGWTPDGGVTVLGIGATYTVGNSSQTFVAQWTPNTYTVTYDWQGGQAVGAPKVSDDYTVDTGNLPLPSGTSYTRDGFEFEGWALSTTSPTLLTNFQPTGDVVLYAIWRDGNFTISYDGKGAQSGGGSGTVGRGLSATLPTPIRAGFVFLGWHTHPTAGVKVGDGGQAFSPDRSQTLYARWVQRSLFGVDEADLETAVAFTVGSGGTGGSFTKNTTGKPTATVTIPNGALPDGTVVSARYFRSLDRQSALIQDDNALIFSLLVSWLNGTGDSATVPDTDPNIPITVTFNSDAIRIGQMIYKVIGDQVTELGRATANGTITVELYEDPEIVLAATAPSLPTGITAIPGPSSSVVSWTAPQSDGGSPITGYIVTANPGGETCTTTLTSCTVTNLVNGINYTFEVVALNAIGGSPTSSPSAAIAPALRTFTATFDSNGGSAVAPVSFVESSVISAPANPTRAGFTFDGWSTFQNDAATKVSFPYQSSDLNLTFYALWVAIPQAPSSEPIRSETLPIPQLPVGDGPPSKIGFTPTKPTTSVWSTGANAQVRGVPGQATVAIAAGGQTITTTGNGWTISLQAKNRAGKTLSAIRPTGLQSQVAGSVQIIATGLRPNSFVEVWSAENLKYIGTLSVGPDGSVNQPLVLPNRLLIGEHTLQLGALDSFGRLITLNSPLRINGKVTVGTFKGNITIYTTQLEGQKLSAKVAGKWIVQDPITKFKHHGFSRLIRYTGAGYRINVHVYVNGEFLRTQRTLTR